MVIPNYDIANYGDKNTFYLQKFFLDLEKNSDNLFHGMKNF